MTRKAIEVVALALLLSTRFAPAADTNAPTPPKQVARHVEQDLSKQDPNETSRLAPDELEALRRDNLRKRQEQFEARAKAAVEARCIETSARYTCMIPPALLKQYDTNTNGFLNAF